MSVKRGDMVQFRNRSGHLVTGQVTRESQYDHVIVDVNGIQEAANISHRDFHVIDKVTGRHSQTPQYHAAEANAVAGSGCAALILILLVVGGFIYIMATGSSPTDLLQ